MSPVEILESIEYQFLGLLKRWDALTCTLYSDSVHVLVHIVYCFGSRSASLGSFPCSIRYSENTNETVTNDFKQNFVGHRYRRLYSITDAYLEDDDDVGLLTPVLLRTRRSSLPGSRDDER